jgi:hypothetical protein
MLERSEEAAKVLRQGQRERSRLPSPGCCLVTTASPEEAFELLVAMDLYDLRERGASAEEVRSAEAEIRLRRRNEQEKQRRREAARTARRAASDATGSRRRSARPALRPHDRRRAGGGRDAVVRDRDGHTAGRKARRAADFDVQRPFEELGARDRIRTGDNRVGNAVLYQLSYSCLRPGSLAGRPRGSSARGGLLGGPPAALL